MMTSISLLIVEILLSVVQAGTLHWSQQSLVHIVDFPKQATSITHLSFCTKIQLDLSDQLICKKMKFRQIESFVNPHYVSIISSNRHTIISKKEKDFILSLEKNTPNNCPYYYGSIWLHTNRNTIDYKTRCRIKILNETNMNTYSSFHQPIRSVYNGDIEKNSTLIATPITSSPITTSTNAPPFSKSSSKTSTISLPPGGASRLPPSSPPPAANSGSVIAKGVQPKHARQLFLSFIETNMKISALASAGVQTKEIYAMVVDKVGNLMPEIITQMISKLIKIPMVTLIGQLLSALLPNTLVPNSGATPNVPIVPGLDPIKPDKAPTCSCSGGASFSLLEQWRKQKGIDGNQWSSFVEENTKCDCNEGGTNVKNSDENESSFLEENEKMKDNDQIEDALYHLNENYGNTPGNSGGANGGPIAKIEPKVLAAVMEGLQSNCMPSLQEELANKIIELWPTVKYSVYRGSVRGLSQSLTKSITNKLVEALMGKLFHGLTKHTTRELVTSVTIGLTHSLSSTISHALSRSPKDDYYCHYCELHQLYCNMCKKGTIKEYELDYKISYYSTYYSTYYSRFYGTTISDFFASHPGSDQHNKGF